MRNVCEYSIHHIILPDLNIKASFTNSNIFMLTIYTSEFRSYLGKWGKTGTLREILNKNIFQTL